MLTLVKHPQPSWLLDAKIPAWIPGINGYWFFPGMSTVNPDTHVSKFRIVKDEARRASNSR